ncbi:MAG: hypothetical protein CSB06_02955 [Bacteroidia bacterium]|nr:MAG: hypothetical protein CSB06_02955 [Bacteroidia bacterium]
MKKTFIYSIFILFFLNTVSYSQKEDYNWIFSENIHIDFNQNPPMVSTIPHTLMPHDCTSMSDKDGNLLFYTDISNIYNFNHQLISKILKQSKHSKTVRVIPHPTRKYCFFYISRIQKVNYKKTQVLYLIDMNANGGKGSFSRISLINPKEKYLTNKFLVTRKFNSKDYWLLRFNKNKIIRNTIDSSGFKNDTYIDDFINIHHIKISPDMSKLFILDSSRTKFYIADYDCKTARINHIQQFGEENDPNGKAMLFEFSKNGNYLFHITKKYNKEKCAVVVYDMSQIDGSLNNGDTLSVINPTGKKENPYDASLAPNGNIYITFPGAEYLLAVEEDAGYPEKYVLNKKALYLNGNKASSSLPHYFNYHLSFKCDIIDCNTVSFYSYQENTLQSQHWDFGDGDTSDLLDPTHTYTAPGKYTVTLTGKYSDGTSRTLSKTITISPKPQVPKIVFD